VPDWRATARNTFISFCYIPLDISKLFGYSLVDGSPVSVPATAGEASGATVAPHKSGLLAWFQKLLPVEVFQAALQQAQVRENNRVYNSAVVVGADDLPALAGAGYAGERGVRVARRAARQLLAAAR